MPELPEVETVRRGLQRRLIDRRLSDVRVTGQRTVRRTSSGDLTNALEGATVQMIDRVGKYLIVGLDDEMRVMIHLRMSGQLLVASHEVPRPPHTHVAARLSDVGDDQHDEELRFVDPRTFGEVVAYRFSDQEQVVPELGRLGWDPLDQPDAMSPKRWHHALRGCRRQLKAFLLDQHVVAGLGNIYTDEVLHRARLRPDRRSDEVSPVQARRLLDAIHTVLNAAVDAGGSSLRDAQYVDVDGRVGGYQVHHRVVDRAGRWCVTCQRARIRRVVAAGRSTYFCPWCQR
jgi:formamidopyrimidine-DNA glycosylase